MIRSRMDSLEFLPTVRTMLVNILIEEILCMVVLSLFQSFLKVTAGQYTAYITMLVIFTALTYLELWKYGAGDRNLVNFGKMKKDRFRGAKLGLVAAIPFFALDAWFAINAFLKPVTSYISLGILRLFNAHMIVVINSIFTVDLVLTETPVQLTISQAAILALMPLYIAVISEIGYLFGFNDISIIRKTVYKKQ